MELNKESRQSIADAQNISNIIGKKLSEDKDKGKVKEGVNLENIAKNLAKRKMENLKK